MVCLQLLNVIYAFPSPVIQAATEWNIRTVTVSEIEHDDPGRCYDVIVRNFITQG